MATTRAKRLVEYLSNVLGWQVFDETRQCKKCGTKDYGMSDLFCRQCGTKMPATTVQSKREVFDALESALKYALKEK